MASSNVLATSALLIAFNLLFFTLVTSTHPSHPSPPPPASGLWPPPTSGIVSPPASGLVSPPASGLVPPLASSGLVPPPASGLVPPPASGGAVPPANNACPIDALKLGVCANLLTELLNLVVGTPANSPCCTLIGGLADLEAAVCLCTAIKANILGINLNVPISLSLLLINCGKNSPSGFQCA